MHLYQLFFDQYESCLAFAGVRPIRSKGAAELYGRLVQDVDSEGRVVVHLKAIGTLEEGWIARANKPRVKRVEVYQEVFAAPRPNQGL